MAVSKRLKAWKAKLTPGKQYPIEEALKLVKEFATSKFAETVDAAINLGRVIASPDAMRVVGQLGQILGPRGLMPNPKVDTVTPDVATAVKNAKSGQVTYRVDKAGIVHCTIGKANFEVTALKENLHALIADLQKAKTASSKGVYLKRVTLASTMGPGVRVDQATI